MRILCLCNVIWNWILYVSLIYLSESHKLNQLHHPWLNYPNDKKITISHHFLCYCFYKVQFLSSSAPDSVSYYMQHFRYWPIHSAVSVDELCCLIPRHSTVEPGLCDMYPWLQTRSWHLQQTGTTSWWPPPPLPRIALCRSNGLCFLWIFYNTTNTPCEVHCHTRPHTFLHDTKLLMWVHSVFL